MAEDGAGGTGTGDTGTPDFAQMLPDDLRGHEALKGFTDAGSLAKAYVEASGRIPKIPEGPDKYAFDAKLDAKEAKEWAAAAHKAGLTQEQAAAALGYMASREEARTASEIAAYEAEVADLRKAWPGDQFDKNLATAQKAVKRFGGEDFIKFLNDTGLGNRRAMIETFHKIGSMMSEDSLLVGDQRPPAAGVKRNEFGQPTLTFPSMPT